MTSYYDAKVVAITGAASGLGRALATRLSRLGAHLALADVDADGLATLAASLETPVITDVIDVADRDLVHAWATRVADTFGGCDILVNNAGLVVRTSIEAATYEDLELGFGANLWGVINGTKAFLPLLHQAHRGHLVNIASINAMIPFAGNGIYNAAKAAVLSLSETLSQELHGSSVAVTCCLPGGMRTGIVRNGVHVSQREIRAFERNRIGSIRPETAARRLLRSVRRRRRVVFLGGDSHWLQAMRRLFPRASVRVAGRATARLAKRPPARGTPEPVPELGRLSGVPEVRGNDRRDVEA